MWQKRQSSHIRSSHKPRMLCFYNSKLFHKKNLAYAHLQKICLKTKYFPLFLTGWMTTSIMISLTCHAKEKVLTDIFTHIIKASVLAELNSLLKTTPADMLHIPLLSLKVCVFGNSADDFLQPAGKGNNKLSGVEHKKLDCSVKNGA